MKVMESPCANSWVPHSWLLREVKGHASHVNPGGTLKQMLKDLDVDENMDYQALGGGQMHSKQLQCSKALRLSRCVRLPRTSALARILHGHVRGL